MGDALNGINARDRAILSFESGWWLVADGRPKRQAIREELSLSPARYYAILESLLDSRAAASAHPLVIARLRRRRTTRRRERMIGGETVRRSP